MFVSFALGCGGGGGGGGGGNGPRVEAPAPSVERYATENEAGAAIDGEGAELIAAALRAQAEERSYALEGDARLATFCRWLSALVGPQGELPEREVMELFARHLGLVEPLPHVIVIGQPDTGALAQAIGEGAGTLFSRQAYNRYGGVVIPREGLKLAVVALSLRRLSLSAIARRVAPEQPLAIRGSLVEGYQNPRFVLQQPSGEITRLPAGAGPGFNVRLPIGGPGAYRVEILARGEQGDSVIANFPVYVGVEIPSSVAVNTPTSGGSGEVGGIGGELLTMLNAERREAGLPPLAFHDGLARVALAHSRDMSDHHFIGHTSPSTGTPADRVRAAHLTSGMVLENIGRGYSASEIHHGLLDSPGHRANLLSPDVTHIGIGVVEEPEGSRSAYLATQVFVRIADAINTAEAPPQVVELINRNRRSRGVSALEADENLTEAAAQAARGFFEHPDWSQRDAVDEASSQLRRFAIAYSRVGGVMAVVSQIDEAGSLEPTFDPTARYIGVGVAQGTRPDTGPNAIAVVIVLGWPR